VGGASANLLPEVQTDGPPAPNPSLHAQERVEGGESIVHGFAIARQPTAVIASEAKQSMAQQSKCELLRRKGSSH